MRLVVSFQPFGRSVGYVVAARPGSVGGCNCGEVAVSIDGGHGLVAELDARVQGVLVVTGLAVAGSAFEGHDVLVLGVEGAQHLLAALFFVFESIFLKKVGQKFENRNEVAVTSHRR